LFSLAVLRFFVSHRGVEEAVYNGHRRSGQQEFFKKIIFFINVCRGGIDPLPEPQFSCGFRGRDRRQFSLTRGRE